MFGTFNMKYSSLSLDVFQYVLDDPPIRVSYNFFVEQIQNSEHELRLWYV